jgi:type II secretory pathway pseudopilin PulG
VRRRSNAGFTLTDVVMALGVMGVLSATALPLLTDVADSMKLGQALREVERELQAARLKAVTANRPMRVRFNCPAAGGYRMVELLGTPAVPQADDADGAMTRCQQTAYPYPADPDRDPLTRPNHDGPTRELPDTVTFGATETLEFWPDGSVHADEGTGNPWPVVPNSGTAITLVKDGKVRSITVNGIGKVTYVQ